MTLTTLLIKLLSRGTWRVAYEPNPDAADDRNAPPQKFTLAFSTADVAILGWRLETLAKRLCENELAVVRILPKRYADLDRFKTFVASIKITTIEKK
jgi:hypothetical protein